MAERKWKRFEEAAVGKWKGRGGARVSITPMGEITFDVATYRAMGEPQAVSLLYESETSTIGIEPGYGDDPNTLMVRCRHARSNRIVRSVAFFRKHGLLPVTTLIVPSAYLEGKVLVLEMDKAVALSAGWKKVERAEAKRVAAAEIRDERERQREELRAEKERLKAERHQLSQERVRIRLERQEMERAARESKREVERDRRQWERQHRRASESF